MPELSNYLLREKSLKKFLAAIGQDLAQERISSLDEFFLFDLDDAEQAESFANQLNELIKNNSRDKVKSLSLEELIAADIVQATGDDLQQLETHRQSCKALLEIIKTQGARFAFSQESGRLELTLPNPAYASMLNLLDFPHLFISGEGKLVFDLKTYLRNTPETLIQITREDSNESPLLFLNSNTLKAQKIYYATKKLDDGRVEVTPYFFVPHTISPPDYHFILDVSGSMERALPELKKSAKALAQQLFAFQPDAKLTITTFSDGVKEIGVYKADQFEQLNSDVDHLAVESLTPLYEVTADFLDRISSDTNQNNVLLFTDGAEMGSKEGSESRIQRVVTGLGAESSVRVRNKFNIFSYNIGQDSLMHAVAQAFASEVVETSSADFVAAQKDPELLMRWAAARDLFSMRLVVTNMLGDQTIEEYKQNLDMSGQLTSLKPRICRPGETLEVFVADGQGKQLLPNSMPFVTPAAVQETPQETNFIAKFFLDCVDQCIEVARDYITDVARTCPSYFPADHSNYWQTNGQVFFDKRLPNGYLNCTVQQIATNPALPLQLG